MKSDYLKAVVLTDLKHKWHIFQLDDSSTKVNIVEYSIDKLSTAISFIKKLLPQTSKHDGDHLDEEETRATKRLKTALTWCAPEIISLDVSNQPDISNRNDLKLKVSAGKHLRTMILNATNSDVAHMPDVFDVMSDKEIDNWYINQLYHLLEREPLFVDKMPLYNSMYS